MSTDSTRSFRKALFSAPGLLWIGLFLVLPTLLFLPIAFASANPYGLPALPITLDTFKEVVGFMFFGWTPANIMIVIRSILQGLITTIASLIVAFPVAYFISQSRSYLKPLLLVLIIIPSWTNQVVRAYAWMELLGPNTMLSQLAAAIGWIRPDMSLYPSGVAVLIGLVYSYLPYMVIPIYAAMEGMEWSLCEAAQDLYASPIAVFSRVILPQTMGGIIVGTILVLVPSFSNYIIPELMGGNKSLMLGNLIANQFSSTPDWPYGAALSVVLIGISFILLLILKLLTRLTGSQEGAML